MSNIPIPAKDVALSANIIDFDVDGALHRRFYG